MFSLTWKKLNVIKIFHELLYVLRTGSRLIAECFMFMFEDDRIKFKSQKFRVSAYSRARLIADKIR